MIKSLKNFKNFNATPMMVAQEAAEVGERIYEGIVERGQYDKAICATELEFKKERAKDKEDLKRLRELYKTKKLRLEALMELRKQGVADDALKTFSDVTRKL